MKIGKKCYLVFKLNAFKGVKKVQQKRNFIAKGVVTNYSKSNAAKTKSTLKNTFFDQNKRIIINILFSERVMSLHLSKFGI